jgi:hypothetical protein
MHCYSFLDQRSRGLVENTYLVQVYDVRTRACNLDTTTSWLMAHAMGVSSLESDLRSSHYFISIRLPADLHFSACTAALQACDSGERFSLRIHMSMSQPLLHHPCSMAASPTSPMPSPRPTSLLFPSPSITSEQAHPTLACERRRLANKHSQHPIKSSANAPYPAHSAPKPFHHLNTIRLGNTQH